MDSIGGNFTYTDTVSVLSATPNFCGKPELSLVYADDYSSNVTDYLTLNSSLSANIGYISYAAGMCRRDLARSQPYQLSIRLSYQNGSIVTLTDEKINITLNDPCNYTV